MCGGRATFQGVVFSISELSLGRTSVSCPAMNVRRASEKLGERISSRVNEHWAANISETCSKVSGVKYNGAMYLRRKLRSSSESAGSSSGRRSGVFPLSLVLRVKSRPMGEWMFALGRSNMSALPCNCVRELFSASFSSSPPT